LVVVNGCVLVDFVIHIVVGLKPPPLLVYKLVALKPFGYLGTGLLCVVAQKPLKCAVWPKDSWHLLLKRNRWGCAIRRRKWRKGDVVLLHKVVFDLLKVRETIQLALNLTFHKERSGFHTIFTFQQQRSATCAITAKHKKGVMSLVGEFNLLVGNFNILVGEFNI